MFVLSFQKDKNKNEKKVSVIVPAYNVEKYISKCLDSLVNQTYENIEIILINDGSIDNTGLICEKYSKTDDRIKYINKKNGGVSSARNVGLDKATGEYILFVDSDDWIEEKTIEVLINNIDDCDVVEFNVAVQSKTGRWDFRKFDSEEVVLDGAMYDDLYLNVVCFEEYDRRHGFYGKFRCVAGKMYSRKSIGASKFNDKMMFYEDGEFFLKIYNRGIKIKCLDEVLYYYRYNESACTKSYRPRMEEESKMVFDCMNDILTEMNKKELLDYLLLEMFVNNVKNEVRKKDFNYAKFKKILKDEFWNINNLNIKKSFVNSKFNLIYSLIKMKMTYFAYLLFRINRK